MDTQANKYTSTQPAQLEPTNTESKKILHIDIETLDTKTTAQVAEIAWLLVDEEGTAISAFESLLTSRLQSKRTRSAATMHFHDQSTGLIERYNAVRAVYGLRDAKEVIQNLNDLLSTLDSDKMIYCFGLSFDVPILQSLAGDVGTELKFPSYRNLRCLRTELATAKSLGFIETKVETVHAAMADCKNQAQLLTDINKFYKTLRTREKESE